MIWSNFLPRGVVEGWRVTGLNVRLGVGVASIVLFTILWDLLGNSVSLGVAWPITGLVAAVGWARLGLSVRPMVVLMLIGFAFDSVSLAPFGVHPLVFLSTYALLASIGLVIGGEMDPLTGSVLPYLGIATGVALLWIFASVIVSGPVEALPLLFAGGMTALFYLVFEGLFDLDSARTSAKGG
ncbi:MAG: hypothetical protein AAF253_01360 [Pseudomonadota bacterium]